MMRIRFRYGSWLAWVLGVGAITLYPWVFVLYSKAQTPRYLVEHEFVHVRQVRALGWLRFYASYLWEYFGHLLRLRSRDAAYMAVSFEKEAYAKQETAKLSDAERAEIGA